MALHTEPFDITDYLTDEETISAYLTEVSDSDDLRYIAKALEAIARVRSRMTQL